MGDEAERSTNEIRQLVRVLDPRNGGKHRARLSKIEDFKQYVQGYLTSSEDHRSTPDFYDDDYSFLYLGIHPDDEEQDISQSYGLLHACGAKKKE